MNDTPLREQSTENLKAIQISLEKQYANIKSQKLSLDLTRGKPATEQLDLANDLDGILDGFYLLQDGTDVRNYGGILGIPEARQLGGELLSLPLHEVMAGGNSSLTLMYQYVAHMMDKSWRQEAIEKNSTVKFLCPVPGYDRHFTICEHFDIEMINIDMNNEGPDMSQVNTLVKEDTMIKGIWCVPKYSNPTGITYSDTTVKAMAALPSSAGAEFRIFWDNAYAVHHLSDHHDTLHNLMDVARKKETADHVVMLGSTSKITFAGAGVAFVGLSESNLKAFENYLSASMIGADKVNQLRHVRFLVDADGIAAHMQKHRAIIEPRFNLCDKKLQQGLGSLDIASWTQPHGGYFISLNTMPGLASITITLAAAAGVKLTPAGATYPYGRDPEDKNIRIAPTYPSISALDQALEVFVVCLQLASVNALLKQL